MHPQLTDKRLVCREFIKALEECHTSWWGARYFGSCNREKRELNVCLRKERIGRAAHNRELAKDRRYRRDAAWQEFNAE